MILNLISGIEARIASLSVSCCQTPEQSAVRDALIEENEKFLDSLEHWFPSAFLESSYRDEV